MNEDQARLEAALRNLAAAILEPWLRALAAGILKRFRPPGG